MHKTPSIVFFGTAEVSIAVLEELKEAGFIPSLIVAPLDKPKGRKLTLTPPLSKVWAKEHNIPYVQPKTLKKDLPKKLVSPANSRWDLFIVAAYGKIIPQEVLNIPKHGTLNVHPSLLPKLRGASPIQSAILGDIRETGVTIILLDEEIDHGPILAQASVEMEEWPPKASVLRDLLAHEGGKLLVEVIPLWVTGKIIPEEQDHSKATYIEKIKKEDGLIDLQGDPYKNFLKIKAFNPWPGTYFFIKKEGRQIRVKIVDAEFTSVSAGSKNKELVITRVTPEGKKEMDYADFIRGL